ncbi:sn-glycerol-3-phosphate ABC transporter ATP-binding protein UgpC [Propylenella binzhouense]|uniref:Sn-glycerol-3-phosphate ABC transporter ATP-binding protein UgpC n=1 Tax=Propylenella binzhouense TaxID=2555902 RepID=A0A964WTX5_9HYPH|nr:sn-glycerol-3-phosphate ABC transporter ATP-binding protein UgpC [Propylenella binzhouense]
MSAVTIEGVHKHFGGFHALKGVDLEIRDGEFVVLVGPSGCGKSTLLRLIAGLEEINEGRIAIGDRIVNDLSPRDRNIAMVFQSYALYPHMTVAQNIAFNLRLAGRSRAEIAAKVSAAAKMLELESLLDRRPAELSGGQRQRVAMGRAMVRNPDVFLFDEPLSNLDAKLRVQMRSEIKSLHQAVGTTSIYVTHDQIEAMTLADRVVVLKAGSIQQQGKPLEIYRKPANRFVAEFIGSPPMNFFTGRFLREDRRAAIVASDGTAIGVSRDLAIEEGRIVTIGVRPEHLTLTGDPDGLRGRVKFIDPTGAQTHVTVELAGEPTVIVLDSAVECAPGEILTVKVPRDLVHAFDADTGLRIG